MSLMKEGLSQFGRLGAGKGGIKNKGRTHDVDENKGK